MATSEGLQRGEYPHAWRRHLDELAGTHVLDVAGYETSVDVSGEVLDDVYLPLVSWMFRYGKHTCQRRTMIGLAGIPGSGKSTFAAIVQFIANRVVGPSTLVTVGMDGWHYTNAVLDERTIEDEFGERIPLRRRKGGPASFDVDRLVKALDALAAAEGPVSLPVYDRRLHDPVPDAMTVDPATRAVLLEGNYVLSTAPPWDRVSRLLSSGVLLECDPQAARSRVVARHVRGGLSTADAEAKYDRNDRLNARAVLDTLGRVDVRINLSG